MRRLEWVSGVLFLTLFFLNLLRIVLRYTLGMAWVWEPDVSRLIFIWLVFLGAAVLYVYQGHLAVDFFVSRLSTSNREHLRLVADLLTTVFLIILVLKGIEVTRVRMRIPFDTWDFPTGYAYAAIPICGGMMIFVTLARMAKRLLWEGKR
jgi:TRAP-type C4-dicarboxylate transport system permease small subunit